jgi:hypothetical protein
MILARPIPVSRPAIRGSGAVALPDFEIFEK